MSCHNFKRLYISWVENNIGQYWLNNIDQYCENGDIPILARYSLQYRANIVNNLAPILFAIRVPMNSVHKYGELISTTY